MQGTIFCIKLYNYIQVYLLESFFVLKKNLKKIEYDDFLSKFFFYFHFHRNEYAVTLSYTHCHYFYPSTCLSYYRYKLISLESRPSPVLLLDKESRYYGIHAGLINAYRL